MMKPLTTSGGGLRVQVLLGALSLLAACNKSKTDSSLEPISLEINGFNYTDLYIYSFEVNGHGGGNVFVSTPTSGGGGSVCCVSWWPDPKEPMPLKIKWTRDRKRWCEKEVLVTGPVPANPRHLGVHFFSDGRIEAEVTEDYPEVKLRLESVSAVERKKSGNKVADEQVARCQDGYPY
jgi:hypothetical protein